MTGDRPGSIFVKAVVVTILSSCLGLAVNLVHPESIPYIAENDYQTLVPCPVPGGDVKEIRPDDPVLRHKDTLFVDARTRREYENWTIEGAMNVTFDYLEPTPEKVLEHMVAKIAASGASRVVVFGDGGVPDTGEQLAKEISARGINNVMFVTGGAPALMKAFGSHGNQKDRK